jgi:2-phospho-L-lactate guanylyltransferase (CobY/MobA/RfbA family)
MPTVVIPFAGAEGKTRLHASARIRRALAHAMFCDVLAACLQIGRTRVVTPDERAAASAREAGAEAVDDPGGGQGAAVQAGLGGVEPGGILVVNADVPCVVPHDLRSLLASTPAGCLALVEGPDGTTNALSLPSPDVFAPLTAQAAPTASARARPRLASRPSRSQCRISPTTSTRWTI